MLENLFASRIDTKSQSRLVGLFPDNNFTDTISFGGGCPDEQLFPATELTAAYQDAVCRQMNHSFQYHDIKGPERLREYLAARAHDKMGIDHVTADDVMLTAGGQQGIELVAKLFIGKGDAMAVEAPSYIGALAAFDAYEPRYYQVGMESDGANLDQFEAILKEHPEIKLFYTVPDFHNPTGITMSLKKRERLVELANKYDFVILEDTPYRDLRYHGQSLPSIKSLDTEGRVIFLSSFSKILTPAFRLGWLVASPEIKEQLTSLKLAEDLEVPYIPSATVDSYIANNDLDQHIEKLKDLYRAKLDAMYKDLKRNLPAGTKLSHPEGGFFFWIELDPEIDTTSMLWDQSVPDQHLIYVPSENFYPKRDIKNGMRVNFTGSTIKQISDGCRRLRTVIDGAEISLPELSVAI